MSFLCILMHNHLSHSHITKILAGISFFFKLHSLPPLNVFFSVKQALKGYRKSTFVPEKRKPISIEMLKQLCLSTGQVCHDQFEAFIFQAAFCLAFFAALRVSELVPLNNSDTSGLRFQDVFVSGSGIRLFIPHSKTDQLGKGCWVQPHPCGDPIICPLVVITKYMSLRPPLSGNFLIHSEGLPLTKYQLSSVFKKFLGVIGLSDSLSLTHFFCIGVPQRRLGWA